MKAGRKLDTEARARITAVLADPEWHHASHQAVADRAKAGEALVRAVRRERGYQRPPGIAYRQCSPRPKLPLTPARVSLLADVLAHGMLVPSIRAMLTTPEGASLRAQVKLQREAMNG